MHFHCLADQGLSGLLSLLTLSHRCVHCQLWQVWFLSGLPRLGPHEKAWVPLGTNLPMVGWAAAASCFLLAVTKCKSSHIAVERSSRLAQVPVLQGLWCTAPEAKAVLR